MNAMMTPACSTATPSPRRSAQSVLPDVHGVHRRGGTAARPRHRARRRRSRRPRSTSATRCSAGTESGLWVDLQRLPATATLDELLALVAAAQRQRRATTASSCSRRCRRRWARGAAQRVFDAIDPDKDVDGFHPVNVGRLVQGRAHLDAVHAVRRDRDARPQRHRDRGRARRRHRAAARSSASRWRCCSCSATRR